MGLVETTSTASMARSPLEILVFEHTEMGTGGLILNQPTPILLKALKIPRFEPFGELPLMLGCHMTEDNKRKGDDSMSATNNLSLGDLSPWFWLHDIDDIVGSYQLEGAALNGGNKNLYMGGSIDELSRRIEAEHIDPVNHFKFFRKYVRWEEGQLEQEIQDGRWTAAAQDPQAALRAVFPSLKL